MKFSPLLLAAAIAAGAMVPVRAADIVFTEGGSDLTWFYDSTSDSWDMVFRAAGSTVADGLTAPYAGPPGGVGGSANDYEFSTLTAIVSSILIAELNGNSYYTLGPSASPGRPDLGMRTRLRELVDGSPVDQFSAFRLTIDWDNSIKPDGAEFAMWNVDAFGDPSTIRYETIADNTTSDWAVWGHDHWIWGFSKPGQYDVQLQWVGLDGSGNPASSVGMQTLSFTIVPEPATFGLMAFAGIALAGLIWRRR